MRARELLVDTYTYIPPVRALEGLDAPDAERHVPPANHSIAEIVAHAAFWQHWFCRRCDGIAEPMPASAAAGWPSVTEGSWPRIREEFLTGLERVVEIGDRTDGASVSLAPAIEFPPLAHYTIQDALVHVAQHNAHHLGQVILLRQLMGLWPPPAGSWTW